MKPLSNTDKIIWLNIFSECLIFDEKLWDAFRNIYTENGYTGSFFFSVWFIDNIIKYTIVNFFRDTMMTIDEKSLTYFHRCPLDGENV